MTFVQFAKKLRPSRSVDTEVEGTQYGAIPYRVIDGQVVFLMITSRRSANWVFPKGSHLKGTEPWETAAEEAYEEAGIRGEMGDAPVGFYLHPRNKEGAGLVCVQLFPMRVTEQLDTWPEEMERFRHWALLPQLRRLMASKQAAQVAVDLNRHILNGDYIVGRARTSA